MDTALKLKGKFRNKELSDYNEAQDLLNNSKLFSALLEDSGFDIMGLLWRLTQLSEIPFAGLNDKVKVWTKQLGDSAFTGEGFSLDGTNNYMLACYNGMITSILIKLNFDDSDKIDHGINWILKYQNVKRGEVSSWTGESLKKYGGCMKSTPCYMGLVKSVIALSDYKKSDNYQKDEALELKLSAGLEYILNQRAFLRLTDDTPITTEITKLVYPFTWKVNIVEILRLLKDNDLLSDKRCDSAKLYLKSKMKKDGFWRGQSSHITKSGNWIPFDKPKEKGFWISDAINDILN